MKRTLSIQAGAVDRYNRQMLYVHVTSVYLAKPSISKYKMCLTFQSPIHVFDYKFYLQINLNFSKNLGHKNILQVCECLFDIREEIGAVSGLDDYVVDIGLHVDANLVVEVFLDHSLICHPGILEPK